MAGVTSGVDSPRTKFYRKDNTTQLNTDAGESQSDTSLTRDVNPQYAKSYLQRVLNSDTLPEPPKKELCNGFYQPLYDLHKAHESGGLSNVYEVWERVTKPNNPKLAMLIGQHPGLKGKRRWTFTKACDLYKLPPIEYLYKDVVIRNGVCLLFGQPGVGKSFVALDWSLEIAQTLPVLYVAAEGFSGYADRVKAWCNHHGKSDDNLHFTDEAVNLADSEAVNTFIVETQIDDISPAMIVFDTLARCMVGADENSAKDMGIVMENCDRIKKALGTTVLLVHHAGKSAGSSERGSSALRGGVDVSIEIEDLDGMIKVVCRKNKYDKDFQDFKLGFMEAPAREGSMSVILLPASQLAMEPDNLKVTNTQRTVLDVLNQSIYSAPVDPMGNVLGARYTDLQRELPNVNIYRTLNQLLDKGLVARPVRKREPWKLTEDGKKALLIASKQRGKSGKKSVITSINTEQEKAS